jgi:predicted protein tyrosine phosphatase
MNDAPKQHVAFRMRSSYNSFMFELIVSGYDQALITINTGWPTKIISLVGQKMERYGAHHMHFMFDDISRPIAGYIHPIRDDLARILQFSKLFTDHDKVLVHCLQGISRSTAVAVGILIQHGMSIDDAYNTVALQRPQLSPNLLIITYIDEFFGLKGALIALIAKNERFPNLLHRTPLIEPATTLILPDKKNDSA